MKVFSRYDNVQGNNAEHWLQSQLRVDKRRFDKMAFKDGIERLNTMFEGTKKPVIFIDEASLEDNKTSILKYRFLRNLLRTLQIIPAFMGTNAAATNFVGSNVSGGSRSRESNHMVLCYV